MSRGLLYSIGGGTLAFIFELLKKGGCSALTEEQTEVLDILIANGLLSRSATQSRITGIEELKCKKFFVPAFAWIEVTRQCNMFCPFCYEKSHITCTDTMLFGDFKVAINNVRSVGIKRIQFIGGEPLLLNDGLKDMINCCRDDFDFIEVYSNGVLVNKDWCDFFRQKKINVALSLHSYIPEQHDKLVNYQGAHSKVTKAICLLEENKIPYRIATIRDKNCDIGNPNDNVTYKLTPSNPKLSGRAKFDNYDINMLKDKIITKENFRQSISINKVSIATSGLRCFLKNFYIGTDLTVYPCVMERRFNYGSLRNNTLKNMCNDQQRFLSKNNIVGCKDCEYRYACQDCRPDSCCEDIFSKPWYCSYDPFTGKWADVEQFCAALCGEQ